MFILVERARKIIILYSSGNARKIIIVYSRTIPRINVKGGYGVAKREPWVPCKEGF